MHIGDEGLQHYSPGAPLGHPARALLGYKGVVWDREMSDAPRMPVKGLVLSAFLGFIGVLAWAVKHKISNFKRK